MQEELVNMLSARRGHFRLESGHHGDLWLDLDSLFLRPGRLQGFVLELAHRLSAYDVEALCGPLVGGALLAQEIATQIDCEFYPTERFLQRDGGALYAVEYRLTSTLRELVRGKRVAVVDDVINAGSAARGTISELRSCGAEVVVVGALLVLGTSARVDFAVQNLPLENIASLPSPLWTPAECPLCASKAPLEDVAASHSPGVPPSP